MSAISSPMSSPMWPMTSCPSHGSMHMGPMSSSPRPTPLRGMRPALGGGGPCS
eukprot:CAMPEP_0202406268 /NCGR_PEP_ID=MMETSP1128-20130828/8880_1 /ASSEMBLY_ACC=CAM_ASM_000463 /TAXON_ID=3047 /ORGANISM="Dunaliella tertiolecta, Strain CCMP1320" /LENGTH=52 /DNA_ID=CAMNT_0049011063 /DNA_START=994 /DNA_END=1149 /DNA_ORIENTATION=-